MRQSSSSSAQCGVSLSGDHWCFLAIADFTCRRIRYRLRIPTSRLDHPIPSIPNLAQVSVQDIPSIVHHHTYWNVGRDDSHHVSLLQSLDPLDDCF